MIHSINLTLNLFTDWQELLHNLPNPSQFGDTDELALNINYKCPDFIHPEVLPIMASYILGLRARGVKVNVSFDTDQSCSSFHYAGRMKFFEHIGIPYKYPYKEHEPGGRFIPLTQINSGSYTLDPQFAEQICEDLELQEDVSQAIIFSIGELVANITLHAESPAGGMLYGQRFPQNRTATFILVDPGVGIHSAFINGSNKEYHSLTEKECLEICTNQGVTCGDGRGHGLFVIKEIISRNLGTFRLVSGGHFLSIINGNVSVNKTPYWQGTFIFCEFNLDNKVDLGIVLDSTKYESSELW